MAPQSFPPLEPVQEVQGRAAAGTAIVMAAFPEQGVSSGAETVLLAGAPVQIEAAAAPPERRAVGHVGRESQGFHDRPPFRTMGSHRPRAKPPIHDRMCDFMCHRCREMRMPIHAERFRVETQDLLSIDPSPLTCRAPFQVQTDDGGIVFAHP